MAYDKLKENYERAQRIYRYFFSEERNIYPFYIPAFIYIFLLLLHALWDNIPDYWNSVYTQPTFPEVPPPMLEYSSAQYPNEITVVTAYFNLGDFQKGPINIFTQDMYKQWMSAYSKLNNSVIAFTDSEDIARLFRQERTKHFAETLTQVHVVKRDDFWAFKLAPRIKDIYSEPDYPKFPPNTVNEYYSCAMHIKYELLEIVIKKKLHRTRYLSWVDIGYFREKMNKIYKLEPPDNLKEGHIAYTQIHPFYEYMQPEDIIKNNAVWIAGGFILGKPEYLMIMIEDYRKAVEDLISKRLMDTDQQVLYILYSQYSDVKPRVPVQTIYHLCRCNWFFLGELCRDTYDRQFRPFFPLLNFLSYLV
ncbi:uncharacterized protein LOC134268593 [Saccostrea cucullata]|uniref:uncharacterized protein LOC134268593 n=1 Tax=Saccostrea cuccullata TaxID=36930 RepID=UPI002ED5E948